MLPFRRKKPEELLQSISQLHRGRFKILIGAASGSGKTYHMLREGLQLVKEKIDVVLCAVPVELQPETATLAERFEVVKGVCWELDGTISEDLDLEELLRRNPEVVLIDGLAHRNRKEAKWKTRLEDILFLLDQGISVITTLNVYELEGLNEAALKWTGIKPVCTLPTHTLELADEVRLIDVSPETMLKRLKEGLLGDKAEPALAERGNLAVLRELALRLVAEGVGETLVKHREAQGLTGPSGASERILVTVQYHWNGSLYIRRGQQIARRLGGELLIVTFASPSAKLTREQLTFKTAIKKLASKVEGSFEELPLPHRRRLPGELVRYAEEQHVTRIVMGHSRQSKWQQLMQGALADAVQRKLRQVDLFLMADRTLHEGERVMPIKQRGSAEHELFRRHTAQERERRMEAMRRGKLHLYIGAAPGVGKTYMMLNEANVLLRNGVDVVVGLVETHGRRETQLQIDNLPIIEQKEISYHGTLLKEIDVEAIIRRNPEVVVVDELAHTNMPGSPRKKRYEDVINLLEHGISVLSTMNVQHIESLNDAVKQITGVTVRETVPDAILRLADQMELIDVTPQMLQQRMRDGKIYAMDKVEQALGAFFTTGNLIALRELALRETADDVDERLEAWDRHHSLRGPLRRREIIFVAIDAEEDAERLIRRGFRIAYRLKAEWHVHYVQVEGESAFATREKLEKLRDLTDRLGGLFEISKAGRRMDIATNLLTASNLAKATQLIVGQSRRTWWERLRKRNTVRTLLNTSRHLDMLIVASPKA